MLKNSNLLITQKPVQQKLDQPTKRDWNKRSKCYSCNCKKDEKGKMIKTLECKINSRKKLPMVLTDFSISFVVAYLCYFDCSFQPPLKRTDLKSEDPRIKKIFDTLKLKKLINYEPIPTKEIRVPEIKTSYLEKCLDIVLQTLNFVQETFVDNSKTMIGMIVANLFTAVESFKHYVWLIEKVYFEVGELHISKKNIFNNLKKYF